MRRNPFQTTNIWTILIKSIVLKDKKISGIFFLNTAEGDSFRRTKGRGESLA